jgi:uncharacterized membrane protein
MLVAVQVGMNAAAVLPELDEIPLTTAIARPARLCYELFCDVSHIPEWVAVVHSAKVERRNPRGRPALVSFLASLTRATVGYRLRYEYRERDLGVSWATAPGGGVEVAGWAQFTPLSADACLLTYKLDLDLGGTMATWSDPFFDGHAASAVMSDFRDFATRIAL